MQTARRLVKGPDTAETSEKILARVTTGLQNGTWEKITLKKGTKVTCVTAANIVPPCWHQTQV